MVHVYLIPTSVFQETFIKDVLLVRLDIKLLMVSVENFPIIVLISTFLSIVFSVHQVTSFTVESVIKRSQTVLHKEHLSVTDVILCMSFPMTKDHVFPNSPFVTVNNMTQRLISVLSVKMALESQLTENVSLNNAPNITFKLMSVNNVQIKLSTESIIITL